MYTTLYKTLVWPKLSRMDAEEAHDSATDLLEKISRHPLLCAILKAFLTIHNYRLTRSVMGTNFPNPVGLAAGFSKNGIGLPALRAIGFGFLELGGVTPLPQDGNPKPRMFRLEEDQALINRMGFNNFGARKLRATILDSPPSPTPIGINLGKGKDTPLENAAEDYCHCMEMLYNHTDFFVVNVSSPNTPGLRTLQNTEVLDRILKIIWVKRKMLEQTCAYRKPILVKIAPDMNMEQLDRIVECVEQNGMEGMVIGNTTTSRDGLTGKHRNETGGASGRFLFERSMKLVERAKWQAPNLTVIGVGGIFSGKDAWEMISEAGADLVQIYTGLVFEGPGLVRAINKELLRHLNNAGYNSLEDVA